MGTVRRKINWSILVVLFVNILLIFISRPYVEGVALLGSVLLSLGYIAYSIKKYHDLLFFLLAALAIIGLMFNLAFSEYEIYYLHILIILIVFVTTYTLFSLIFVRVGDISPNYAVYSVGVFFALINIMYGLIFEPGDDRLSGIYQNTLNFTGSMCVFYSASFYNSYMKESHLRTLFLVLLISFVAILSESKSIGLTILVSLLFYLRYFSRPNRYFLIIIIVLVLLSTFDVSHYINSGSNQLRIERYLSAMDSVTLNGIGLEAFSSLSIYTNIPSKGIFESFIGSLFIFSPVYFLILALLILYNAVFKSKFSFNTPKVLFMVTPIFAGSLLTPVTLFNALILLFIINYLLCKRV